MTAWRPPTHEIDPLLEAVVNATRATIAPSASIDAPPPSSDDIRAQRLRDGRELRMRLSAQELQQVQRGVAPAVVYAVRGNAVVDGMGYRITGQAVLDIATRAFFDVDCRLESVGAVTL
jgi:hypothetical protein